MLELTEKDVITLVMYRPDGYDQYEGSSSSSDLEVRHFRDVSGAKDWAVNLLAVFNAEAILSHRRSLATYEMTVLVNGVPEGEAPEEVGSFIIDFSDEVNQESEKLCDRIVKNTLEKEKRKELESSRVAALKQAEEELRHYEKLKAKYEGK